MAALDASIINIALPVLKRDFGVRMHVVEWVSLVYLLTLAGLVVPLARWADMAGRRWMYSLGFSVFVLGSLMCALASSLPMLLVARVVQAVGAAMLQANSVAIITAATPAQDRGKAIGIQAAAQGVGLSLGPAVGGALLSALNWHWIFLVNLPVGVAGTVLGVLLLPRDDRIARRERFDWAGAALLVPGLVALMYCLNMGLKEGWTSPSVTVGYLVFAGSLLGFWAVERRADSPLVDLRLFQNRVFALGSVTGTLSFAVMYAVLFLTPFELDNVQHMDALRSGMYLTIVPIGMTLCTPVAGAVADRLGVRLPTVLGMLAAAAGCACLWATGADLRGAALVAGLFLVGAGLGFFTPPNNSSVMGSAPPTHLGVAGGILNMSRTVGMGLGVTVGGLCYQLSLALAGVADERAATALQMVRAFRWSFAAMAGLALATTMLSAVRNLGA
ncbi:MAG: DHA2 family efflux MFS transporter permease subunit [Alicyclobacillus sp.]|nr:DHA2 family efflux MFS transporter permease subunit [Alicyclobacillus sp.]